VKAREQIMTSHGSPQSHSLPDERTLSERAEEGVRAELRGDRLGILGALGETEPAPLSRKRTVPDRWSFLHVMERMEEGFRVLSRLPMPTRPRGYINSMPTYLYDRGDLNAQLETHELERMARIRNYVRIRPSPAEIDRMDESSTLQARRHADNAAALRELAAKLDQHAASVAMIRPAVAALELSRTKLATWASIGIAGVVVLGWILEAGIKWAVTALLSHFQ
jgi:hypothetical protein